MNEKKEYQIKCEKVTVHAPCGRTEIFREKCNPRLHVKVDIKGWDDFEVIIDVEDWKGVQKLLVYGFKFKDDEKCDTDDFVERLVVRIDGKNYTFKTPSRLLEWWNNLSFPQD